MDISKLDDNKLLMQYFRKHDLDNNHKLDGLELLKAIARMEGNIVHHTCFSSIVKYISKSLSEMSKENLSLPLTSCSIIMLNLLQRMTTTMMMMKKKLQQSQRKRNHPTTDSILNRLYPLWTVFWNRMIRYISHGLMFS